MAYGNYSLREGDRDVGFIYEGQARSAAQGDILPGPGETGFVKQLQLDLTKLGFKLLGNSDGIFGMRTRWAVREFQLYAKMSGVAIESSGPGLPARYVDRLSSVANPAPYNGPVSGVVNGETRAALSIWIANRWRCPVVIEAWKMVANVPTTLVGQNLWLHDELADTAPRMFARDFSGYYTFPASHNAAGMVPVGEFTPALQSGIRSVPPPDPKRHTWAEAELLPENLVGKPLADLDAAELATYKTVRACSDQECVGYFDSLNAYDEAIISLGPCHWTLGQADSMGVRQGELPAFFAYLRYANPAAYSQAIEFFGIAPSKEWKDGANPPNGSLLFKASPRKYEGWIKAESEGAAQTVGGSEAETNYFKTWHWFYRFQMAGRCIPGFRLAMWDMARLRLRDILSAPCGAAVPPVPVPGDGTRPATIGDTFTSEAAVAIVMRWHIYRPAHMVSGGKAGAKLVSALSRAAIPPSAGPPNTWTNIHEDKLIKALVDEVDAAGLPDLKTTVTALQKWPAWTATANPNEYRLPPNIGRLSTSRGSFSLAAQGLPPAPY